MRVILLGTGGSAGVPPIGGVDGGGDWGDCDPAEPRNRRTRTSIVVEGLDKQRLLVDTSPDMRNQLLDCRIPAVDAILFTHAHADHVTGIDDVRMLNRIVERPLSAFASAVTLAEMTKRFGYAFRPWTPPGFYRPVLEGKLVRPGDVFEAAGLAVRVFTQNHGKVESLGLRIGGFGYSTDVLSLDEAAFAALAGVDTWVVGCFPAVGSALYARQSEHGAGLGEPVEAPAHGADAYGDGDGLGVDGGALAGGGGGWVRRDGADGGLGGTL